MIKILGLFPLSGNGGIASWTKKFLSTFPDDNFTIIPIDNSPKDRNGKDGYIKRIISGLTALRRIIREVRQVLKENNPTIMHTTTSGSLGSLRDYVVGHFCRKRGIKTIMHCRYGCIPEDIQNKGPLGWLLRLAMRQYDQIWVLDSRSYEYLKLIPEFQNKVRLTPNSIKVPSSVNLSPKNYKRVGFIGNLIPSKGLFELVEAAINTNIRLDIVGPGSDEVVKKIKELAGENLNSSIFVHGRLPNDRVVEFIDDLEIIALPTYYPWEAFPISILEAMSKGKMVISCPRAAIKDILTDNNGDLCGILVKEKSSKSIEEAIVWLQTNRDKADIMCTRAYEKVKRAYDTEIVYDIYRNNYLNL